MTLKLFAVYYKHILTAIPGMDRQPAIFFSWEKAQELADKMNESMHGYFVAELVCKVKKEKVKLICNHNIKKH
jgi:hypothetical protein